MSQERNAEQTAKELILDFENAVKFFTHPSKAEILAEICAMLCVKKILKANPTHIDCNNTELDYKFWVEVDKKLKRTTINP
jgi:hypothetical protein